MENIKIRGFKNPKIKDGETFESYVERFYKANSKVIRQKVLDIDERNRQLEIERNLRPSEPLNPNKIKKYFINDVLRKRKEFQNRGVEGYSNPIRSVAYSKMDKEERDYFELMDKIKGSKSLRKFKKYLKEHENVKSLNFGLNDIKSLGSQTYFKRGVKYSAYELNNDYGSFVILENQSPKEQADDLYIYHKEDWKNLWSNQFDEMPELTDENLVRFDKPIFDEKYQKKLERVSKKQAKQLTDSLFSQLNKKGNKKKR